MPVSAADGSREGDPNAAPTRHADFTTWQPPEEEGDDEPILGSGAARHAPIDPIARDAIRAAVAAAAAVAPAPPAPPPAFDQPAVGSRGVDTTDGDLAEIYVNVGRRESARAADFQRLLTEVAGIDKTNVRRIRVRERNAFISVRREDLARALAALTGATIAGKIAAAEQARERGEGESAPEGARPIVAEDAAPAEAAPVADGSVEPAIESDAVPTERPSPR